MYILHIGVINVSIEKMFHLFYFYLNLLKIKKKTYSHALFNAKRITSYILPGACRQTYIKYIFHCDIRSVHAFHIHM